VQRPEALAGVEKETGARTSRAGRHADFGVTIQLSDGRGFAGSHRSECNPTASRSISPFFRAFHRHFDRVFRRVFGKLPEGPETLGFPRARAKPE
jgi:hypothetical protein